jgi:1-deoxy-D-xylulose-5-phosphate reductoisomerase
MASRRRIAILGSTGSIGRQSIEVVRSHPDRFEIVALVANSSAAELRAQGADLGVSDLGLGEDAARRAATLDSVDVVLNAVMGAVGLSASVAALEAGKVLALANKESLVAGGEVCMATAARTEATIVPVDSEHAALSQCLRGVEPSSVAHLLLTASGGPFRTRADLHGVTPGDALAHPTWEMGRKITIDSATMMNKGLEVIEAHHLFGLPYDRIGVVVHPQSKVHGVVEFVDGSSVMQAAPADMRIPIQAALSHPQLLPSLIDPVDLERVGSLDFEPLDRARFPAVNIAYRAGRAGRSFPAALNAANEVAVAAFLEERLGFADITRVIESTLERHEPVEATDLDAVLEVDAWARRDAQRAVREVSAIAGRV